MFPLRFAHRMRLSWRSVTSWLTPTSFMLTSAWDKNLSRYFVNFWSNQTELEDFLLISYLMLGFLLTLRVSYRKTIQAKAGIWTINIKVGNVLDSNVWSMFCFMPSIRRNCGQPVKNNFSPRICRSTSQFRRSDWWHFRLKLSADCVHICDTTCNLCLLGWSSSNDVNYARDSISRYQLYSSPYGKPIVPAEIVNDPLTTLTISVSIGRRL